MIEFGSRQMTEQSRQEYLNIMRSEGKTPATDRNPIVDAIREL